MERTKHLQSMKYRAKIAEKVGYTLLMGGGFLCYKSPGLLNYLFVEWAQFSIPGVCLTIAALHLSGLYLEDQHIKSQKYLEELT